MNPIGLLIVGGGVFALAGAIMDWEWFMTTRKARPIVAIFGRNGARIFYGILGIGIAITGILLTFGIESSE